MNKDLMMEAAVKYKGVWPNDRNPFLAVLTTSLSVGGKKVIISVPESFIFSNTWKELCTREQFEDFVSEFYVTPAIIGDTPEQLKEGVQPEAPYMPKVGEVCEYRNCRNDAPVNSLWWEAFYVGDSIDGYKIMQCTEGRGCKHMDESDGDIYEFRPLRTKAEKLVEEYNELNTKKYFDITAYTQWLIDNDKLQS